MRRNLIFAASLFTLAACASANKRYEQGRDLMQQGRPAEASDRYIQALKKDRNLDSARVGLRNAGAAAIAQYIAVATSPSTQPDQAAEQYLAIDDLSKRALEVGIFLPPPGDYETQERAAFDKAIADDIDDAPLLMGNRQFGDALARLERAANAYRPNGDQAARLGRTGATVALAWGRSDTASGQFRSAYSRVQPIASLPGVTQAQVDSAHVLQTLALSRGAKRVVIAAPWGTVNARAQLPEDLLPALGDALYNAPWTSPPPFVNLVQPDLIDRTLRQFGLMRHTMTNLEAARLARSTGADWVVVSEIDSVSRQDQSLRTYRHPVKTRAGADTAYYTDEGSARLFGRTTFVVIDRDGNRVSEYLGVTSSATAPFRRVRFAGDVRQLDLPQSERDLFNQSLNQQQLTSSFVNALSPRLAEAVFLELQRRIP